MFLDELKKKTIISRTIDHEEKSTWRAECAQHVATKFRDLYTHNLLQLPYKRHK